MSSKQIAAGAATALTVVMALALGACGGDDDGSGGGGDGGKDYRLAMVSFPADVNPYEVGAREQAERLGVDFDIQRVQDFSANAQLATVNALAAKRPDAMLAVAIEAKSLEAPLKRVAQGGTKVIMYDSNLENPEAVPVETYVSSDYEEIGRDTGRALAELIDNRGKVLAFNVSPGNTGLEQHLDGFREVLSQHPAIELLPIQYNDAEPTKTSAIVKSTLARDPDLAGIFMGSTNNGAQGGTAALRELGLIGKVKVVTLDAFPAGVKDLERGYVQAIASSRLKEIGQEAVKSAVKALKGEKLPEETLLPGCVVTKENLNDPSVQPCVYTNK